MQTFIFIIPDIPDKKVTEVRASRIELHDNHLILFEEYFGDFKDDELGTTENEYRKDEAVQLRKQITGYKKHWYCKTKVWGVEINMKGVTDNLNPCFKRESHAQEFCDALLEWIIK